MLFARFRAGDVAERLTSFTKVLLPNLLHGHCRTFRWCLMPTAVL
jgi:hypothetical protein